jgi:hypothetical protein
MLTKAIARERRRLDETESGKTPTKTAPKTGIQIRALSISNFK